MGKFVHVTLKEETLMQQCHSKGMGVRKISALTGRPFETVSKHISRNTVARRFS